MKKTPKRPRIIPCEESGAICGHKKLIVFSIIGIIGMLAILGAASMSLNASVLPEAQQTSYGIGRQGWTFSAQLDGGQFGSLTYMIPSSVSTGDLPAYVVGTPTGTSLIVDSDMISKTPVPSWGCMKLMDMLSFTTKYEGLDGPLPQVAAGLSLVWPTDKNGQQTGSPIADSSGTDASGRHWERYYFMVQVYAATQIHPSSQIIGTGDPTGLSPYINSWETSPEHVVLWTKIIVTNPTNNASFFASFDSAKIMTPPQTTGNAIVAGGNPFTYYLSSQYTKIQSGDDPASPTFDSVGNQAVSALFMSGQSIGQGGGSFDLQASGTLQAGAVWNHGLGGMKVDFNSPVDVLWTCGFLVGVVVTGPEGYISPTNPSILAQFLQFFQNAFTALNDPSSWWMWIIVAVVIILLLYLFFGRKGSKSQSSSQTVINVGAPLRHQLAEQRRRERAAKA